MKAYRHYLLSAALLATLLSLTDCGRIIDKDLIVVARIGDREITRGELRKVVREMPDNERPNIQSRGDYTNVLEAYVDEEIRNDLAEKLEQEGKLKVPRELAAAQFDAENPDMAHLDQIEASPALEEQYNIGKAEIQIMRNEREAGIDRVHRKLKGKAAVILRAQQAVQDKTLEVTPQELQEEYDLRGDEFQKFEQILFTGIIFRGDANQARAEAAQVVQRVQNGEKFEDIQAQYRAQNPEMYLEAAGIENNPALEKYRGFWQQASGAEVGQVIGPIFLPPFDKLNPTTGRAESTPGGILVLKVLDHKPEQQKSLEEAATELALPILEAKMMQKLRQEYKAETYPNKLPDPDFS